MSLTFLSVPIAEEKAKLVKASRQNFACSQVSDTTLCGKCFSFLLEKYSEIWQSMDL